MMPRFQPMYLVIALLLAGCKSTSTSSPEGGGATNWFSSSIPSQSEPEVESVAGSEPGGSTSATSESAKAETPKDSNGNLLTRWFQGGSEKAASPRRIPLPLSQSAPKDGDDANESDF